MRFSCVASAAHFLIKGEFKMVDYEKLYLDLFSEITKTVAALEKVKEENFKKFVESNPTKDEARRFSENIKLKNNSPNFFK